MKLSQRIAAKYVKTKLNLLVMASPQKAAAKAFKIFCTPYLHSKKPKPEIFSKAERIVLKQKGNNIVHYRWNKGGTKKVLILHGFQSSCRNFEKYIIQLIKKGYEVIAFDAQAHGESGGKTITMPEYVASIKTVYEKFGPMQSFVAHSFGGLSLMHFLETIPTSETMKVALIAPATETTTAIDFFFTFLKLNDKLRVAFQTHIEEQAGVPPAHYSIARTLQHINASILWVHDEDDEITPLKDVTPIIKRKYKNIQFNITKGLGHQKIYKDSKIIKTVVEFL